MHVLYCIKIIYFMSVPYAHPKTPWKRSLLGRPHQQAYTGGGMNYLSQHYM